MAKGMHGKLNLQQDQRLGMRISQSQVRFVKLLEMNTLELDEAVERELTDNPALEATDNDPIQQELTDDGEEFRESAEEVQQADYADPDEIPHYRLEANNNSPDSPDRGFIQQDDSESLYDYLNRQISERDIDPQTALMARYIIGNLDSNGYLNRPLRSLVDDLAFTQGIEIDSSTADDALSIVRSLEPHGVGASDLQDCLSLQLNAITPVTETSSDASRIITEYFTPFSLKHFHRIISAMKISKERFDKALSLILSLNPKPGAAIGGGADSTAKSIVPDFVIDVYGNDITVSLNNRYPELHIEESFANAVKRMEENTRNRPRKGSEFIISRFNDARDFIRILKQRQETLFSVMTAIVKIQREYFLTEDEHKLRPMGLKDISSLTGYDLSVISRATSNKYAATSWGIFPLRFFFSESFGGEDADAASGRRIEAAIKEIVNAEDKKHPMSDDAICRRMQDDGYDVSRRTIAKYRDRLGIPVARLRKTM